MDIRMQQELTSRRTCVTSNRVPRHEASMIYEVYFSLVLDKEGEISGPCQ